eukprot:734344-Amphidinium_carterae.2
MWTFNSNSFSPAASTSDAPAPSVTDGRGSAVSGVSGVSGNSSSCCTSSCSSASAGNATTSSPKRRCEHPGCSLVKSCQRKTFCVARLTRVHHSAQEDTCSSAHKGSEAGP